MLLRTIILVAAFAPSEAAHGAGLDAAASLTPACPIPVAAEAPPTLATPRPPEQDDFKLVFSCANSTPST